MTFASQLVENIRAIVCNPQLDGNQAAISDGLKKCNKASKLISTALKHSLTIGEKNSLLSCLGQIKSFKEMLKAVKIVGYGYVSRNETAMHRVKWEDLQSAFQSRIRTGVIINIKHTDVKSFLEDCATVFKRRIQNTLKKEEALKVNAALCGEFKITKADEILEESKYLNTANAPIYRVTNLNQWFEEKITKPILNNLDTFEENNSGWALSRVINLMININKFNPLRPGSYIALPKQIARKKACINIQNLDDICFAWAVVSALYPASINIRRTSSYPDPRNVLNLKGIQFPITLRQIPRFENQNNISINVYRLQKCVKSFKVFPYYITKAEQDKHVDLLLIQDSYISEDDMNDLTPVRYHYVWIKNLSRLISPQLSNRDGRKFICNRCLHYFRSQENLDNHTKDCLKIDKLAVPRLPQEEKKILEFKDFSHKEKLPFVIYADTECLLIPVEDDAAKNTQKKQRHEPYSVGYYVKCCYDETLSFYKSYTGPDCMQWFMRELAKFAEDVETVFLCPLPMEPLTSEQNQQLWRVGVCHICEKSFAEKDKMVRDHCHLTGKYRGAAHESCNLNYKDTHAIPVVFHNLTCYDGHMIIKALSEVQGKIDILPINKEKYISFTKHIKDNLIQFRFIDSFRFLASGLDKLASYLEDYPILKSEYSDLTEGQFGLLTRKGVLPYDYMDSWETLEESKLPPKCAFYNSLDGLHISFDAYAHAEKVWTSFNCSTLREYSDLYMKTDILLLADVFEKFRETSFKTYGIDPAHAYTLPGYAWNCMLYKTKQKLELLTDYEMVRFIERGIRGGLSQCTKRYAEANNKYMPDYDSTKESSYLMYFDINNQYGWAMSQHLPYGGFKWLNENEISNLNIASIHNSSDNGYILEVDLEIPQELHNTFSDLPLCPEHKNSKDPEDTKNMKLLATLHNKEKYIIHYRNLQQALKLGVKLAKIHRVLMFKQSAWLKSYIDLNTMLRQNAKNEFEKNLFKLMNNAVFGKTMENIRNHSSVKLITTWDGRYGAEALVSRPEFKSSTIIDENLIIVELAKKEVYFNKPIYVGMCILDLAKTTIYDFHYGYMKNRFQNCNVLYTDTDSLIYEIYHENVYDVIKSDCNKYFDTSDYSENNIYQIPLVNKKVLGMMKDENNGRIMTHFIGLRSKMYVTKLYYTAEEVERELIKLEKANKEDDEIQQALRNLGVTKKIKGVKKSIIKNKITFEDYLNCLDTFLEKTITQRLIRSKKHELHTLQQTKIGLSPHDDKRKISKSSPTTLPWGHFSIAD